MYRQIRFMLVLITSVMFFMVVDEGCVADESIEDEVASNTADIIKGALVASAEMNSRGLVNVRGITSKGKFQTCSGVLLNPLRITLIVITRIGAS